LENRTLLVLVLLPLSLGVLCDQRAVNFTKSCTFNSTWIVDGSVRLFPGARIVVEQDMVFQNGSSISMSIFANNEIPSLKVQGKLRIESGCVFVYETFSASLDFLSFYARSENVIQVSRFFFFFFFFFVLVLKAKKQSGSIPVGLFERTSVLTKDVKDNCIKVSSSQAANENGLHVFVDVNSLSCASKSSLLVYIFLAALFALVAVMIYTVIKWCRKRRAAYTRAVITEDNYDDHH
jgi:hypothetical protein